MTERLNERARRTRAEIVAREAALAVGQNGCFRLRVEDVAGAAGVGKGTVYLDHGDKASLVGASLALLCRDTMDELERRLDGVSDPGERLRGAIRLLAVLPLERPEMQVLLEGRLPCAARWIGADVSPYAELERYFATLVEDARRAGGLKADVDPRFAAQALLAVVSTPAWRETVVEEGPERAEQQLAHVMPGLSVAGDATPL